MAKKLCKLVKKDLIKESFSEYVKLVNEPTHICKSCGRAVNHEKNVCNPKEIE
ncbi:hypothetical protein [Alkaliphilus transvaalensis]|uniref:hypothetical protein n=1 Tax=Alkaliphilus transvaalensis TaxID=114628 RepID=UPI0012EC31A0|nr:hypothetical protein [Alkaliphilus transvaalensis]